VFLNNAHFASRRVEVRLGSGMVPGSRPAGRSGALLRVESLFPEPGLLGAEDGAGLRAGDALSVWLRPFEVLMLEVTARARGARLPARRLAAADAARLGIALALRPAAPQPDLEVRFADAERFTRLGYAQTARCFDTELPSLDGEEQPILAIAVRLRAASDEWKYSPAVAEIVQATARVAAERVLMVPVPDARQFGNTQKAGCSWVVYRTRLPRRWARAGLRLAVHAFLPAGVEPSVEAWVVRRWWRESARPVGDGYYAEAPS
jgi:hypothetical protein